jgi:hypothetical protein
MAIAGSGAITMDQFHVEAGGTSGDECSLNDSDIRGLIGKDAGAAMAMNEWYGASAEFYDFDITNSLRFEDGDNPSLTFTPGSAGNRRTWTWSGWIKRGNLLDGQGFINAGNAPSMGFHENKGYYTLTGVGNSYTSALFRDPSAWYNVVIAFNSAESSAGDRVKYYVNGTQHTMDANHISTNAEYAVNNTVEHSIGVSGVTGSTTYFDGYMAEINLIDGAALTPSSFGETKNDIWIPKDTSGLTFGTNGFRLQFKQTGTGTASSSTIGADTSGNDNHWTSNNLVASDVTIDSPTNNFPVQMHTDANGAGSITEGGLKSQVVSQGNYYSVGTNIGMHGGKYYFEYRPIRGGNNSDGLPNVRLFPDGTSTQTSSDNPAGSIDIECGSEDGSDGIYMVALDLVNGKVYRGRNGSWSNSGDPTSGATGTGAVKSLTAANLTSHLRVGAVHRHDTGTSIITFNFGQEGTFLAYTTAGGNADANGFGNFKYAPPSGYLAICTRNLPDPVATIDPKEDGSPQDYFNTVLYTGAGSGANANTVNTVGFQPDFTWIKNRGDDESHILQDSVMGVANFLQSDTTTQDQDTGGGDIHTFNSAGFILGYTNNRSNATNDTYVAWNWKAGTSFSNDASSTSVGSIDSTGSVNTDVGFSIINYVGSGGNGTYAHGLGVTPEMVMVKDRTDTANWAVYHKAVGTGKYLELNQTDAVTTDSVQFPSVTSTVIGVGVQGDGSITNTDTDNYIAYCFASVDGYSKIGSYTGNGSTAGVFVYTGFRPAFIMMKQTAVDDWGIYDNKRTGQNNDGSAGNSVLYPNINNNEETQASRAIDLLSNGFKLRTSNVTFNENNGTYIYMAFAEQPFKYANAR